jgi:phenylacetate-coenzyme A ligase PaaK-like adenylate-forming protein
MEKKIRIYRQITKEKNVKRSDAIKEFLKKHTDIKRLPLCEKVNYDSSNLLKVLNTPTWNIAPGYLTDFERELKKYGFTPYKEPEI